MIEPAPLRRRQPLSPGKEECKLPHRNKQEGSSLEQKQQAAKNAKEKNKASDTSHLNKKLDGPNRPSI